MSITLLVLSHMAVGAVAYLIGGHQMKRKIEQEIMELLEEHNQRVEERLDKYK